MEYELEDLRRSIDNIDGAMVLILAERFRITQKVGILKKIKGLPPTDQAREAAQFANIESLSENAGLDAKIAS